MNLITRNNYEAFLLDYVEEDLSPELIAELMIFLENNPDLKEDLEAFEIHQLTPENTVLPFKEKLKKEEELISLSNYEDYLIAEIEGQNPKEISALLQLFLINNPTKHVEFLAFKKTKLIPTPVLFVDKKSLKKKEGKVIPMTWWYTSAAAAVIIVLFIVNGLNSNDNQEITPIADKVETNVNVETPEQLIVEEKEELIDQENVVAVNESNKSENVVHKKRKKRNIKKVISQEELQDINLAENMKDEIKDSVPVIINEPIKEEEILYADNVVITYENEVKKDEEVKAQTTRFKIIKEILNQRVKNKFLQQEKNDNGEVTAYAVDLGAVGFSKKRKKNKK